MQIIVDLIGSLNLPQIFADLMEIITPIVNIITEIAKVLITVGSAILSKMIPIVIAIVKLWFEYLKILFKVYAWILTTLFRLLQPILKLVVAITSLIAKIFRVRANAAFFVASRFLLSMEKTTTRTGGTTGKTYDPFGLKKQSKDPLKDPGMFMMMELFTSASEYYSSQQYGSMLGTLEIIHKGIRAEDAYHSTAGYYLDPGQSVPDYSHHLYDEEELHDHELRPGRHARANGGVHNPAGGRDILPHEQAHLRELDLVKEEEWEEEKQEEGLTDDDGEEEDYYGLDQEVLDSNKSPSRLTDTMATNPSRRRTLLGLEQAPGVEPADIEKMRQTREDFIKALIGEDEEYTDSETTPSTTTTSSAPKKTQKPPKKHGPKPTTQEDTFKIPKHLDVEGYSHNEHGTGDDDWRIDHSVNMTSSEVFPLLKGKKLKRPQLHKLHPPKTHKERHEQRKRAVAYTHAIQTAYYKAYKRHIHSGHLPRAIQSTFKHLTGHDHVHEWLKSYHSKYASTGHFIYSNFPNTHSGFLKLLWKQDPDYETRPPFHAWVEKQFNGSLDIPREHWEQAEAYERALEDGLAHDEANGEAALGPIAGKRRLLVNFFQGLLVKLEIL